METKTTPSKALLLGIQLPRVSDAELQGSLAELSRLVHTLGHEVVGTLTQKRTGSGSALVFGEGKLREIAQWTGGPGVVQSPVLKKKSKAAERFGQEPEDETEDSEEFEEEAAEESEEPEEILENAPPEGVSASIVVVDSELSPSQLRNLESALGVDVLDRTGVIIEIFSRHARTKAARLQVEIARLN